MTDEIIQIINQVNKNWSKDLIIRFLYIKLAPYFQRDLLYFLATDDEKFSQYQQGFINRFPYIVCSTLADFYVDLFKQFDIKAEKVISNSAKIPLFALIVEGEQGSYFLDPLSDLFSNQYNLRPYFFGVIPRYKTINKSHPEMVQLPKEYVNELDTELDLNHFLDDYFNTLHISLTDKNNAYDFFNLPKDKDIDLKEVKLLFFNEKFINLGNVQGAFERVQLYTFLNNRMLNQSEKRYVRTKILGGVENAHIGYCIRSKDYDTIYEEQKQDDKYVLVKTSVIKR